MVYNLRKHLPGAEITCVCSGPKKAASEYDISAVSIRAPFPIWRLVAAKLCRCKLLFVSVGAGTIHHALSKWFVASALKMADYRSYRDSFSKDYLATIGVDIKSDPVYPDLAFSLPISIVPGDRGSGRQGAIGVGLMDYYGSGRSANDPEAYREYVGCVACFVAAMLEPCLSG